MKRLITYLLMALPIFASAEMQVPYELISDKFDESIPEGKCVVKGRVIDVTTDKYLNDVVISMYKNEKVIDETGWGGRFKFKLDSGSHSFRFNYPDFESHAITVVGKNQHEVEILVHMRPNGRPMITRKPVIYLYPQESTSVSVDVQFVGDITFSYPEYETGWNVVAHPDGTIEHNDRTYPYLFWEGNQKQFMSSRNTNEGFVVESHEVITFLEDKLDRFGLSNKEATDFITYWAPIMEQNEYNYVHFLFDDEYDEFISTMKISPQPDKIMRIYMAYQPLRQPIDVVPQEIPSTERNGFTVVEWGGGEVMAFPGE